MPATSLKPLAYVDQFLGLKTDVDPDKVPDGYLIRAQNIRFVSGGGFYTRAGMQTLWNVGTTKKIDFMGVMEEFSCLFIHSNTKVYVAKDISSTPYDIGLTLTSGYPSQMQEYNGYMRIVNGNPIDAEQKVAVATVATQFDNTATRINIPQGYGANFATGTVYCKGQSITFTGILSFSTAVTFTADSTTDTITASGHGLQNGDTLTVANTGGALPAGLTANTTYYVINAATNTFKVSLTNGGSAVDITDNGSGTNKFTPLNDYLFGCTIPSGTYEVGHIVTQTASQASNPAGTVIESAFEKIMIAGVPGKRHFVQYSVTGSPDDFSSAGSGSQIYGKYGKVTAMRTLLNNLYVAKDKGIEAWTGFDSNGIPILNDLNEAYGIVNANCFKRMGDILVMFTTIRGVKTIEPATIGFNPQPVINPYFDSIIVGTLRGLDSMQTGASMGYGTFDRLMRLTCFLNSQRQTILYDTLAKGFSVDVGYVPNCWVEWNGQVLMGSALDDTVYLAETGYVDGATATGAPPKLDVLTPNHFVTDRRSKATLGHVYLTGIIKDTTKATITIYCDGVAQRVFTLDGSAAYVNKSGARPFGYDFYGHDPFGEAGNEDPANGFSFGVGINVNCACKSIQLRFESQGVGYRLQISSYEFVRGNDSTSGVTEDDLY